MPFRAKGERVVQHFASFLDITDRIEREREWLRDKETLDRRVAARTKRLQQVDAKLEEERRRRTEAIPRDALAQGQEDLRYRDFLIGEVNHRTRNAIQLAISLLTIQARQSEDTACRGALDAAAGRLQRIGGGYALLTHQGDNLERVDFPDYLRRLCGELAQSREPAPRGATRADRGRGGDQRAQASLPRRYRVARQAALRPGVGGAPDIPARARVEASTWRARMGETVWTGGCLCGDIRFEATGSPGHPHTCSCRMCQRHTGALTAVWVEFPRERVAWTGPRGEPARWRSSEKSSRAFCPACGSALGALDDAPVVALLTGAFDKPGAAALRPAAHSYRGGRPRWWRVDTA